MPEAEENFTPSFVDFFPGKKCYNYSTARQGNLALTLMSVFSDVQITAPMEAWGPNREVWVEEVRSRQNYAPPLERVTRSRTLAVLTAADGPHRQYIRSYPIEQKLARGEFLTKQEKASLEWILRYAGAEEVFSDAIREWVGHNALDSALLGLQLSDLLQELAAVPPRALVPYNITPHNISGG